MGNNLTPSSHHYKTAHAERALPGKMTCRQAQSPPRAAFLLRRARSGFLAILVAWPSLLLETTVAHPQEASDHDARHVRHGHAVWEQLRHVFSKIAAQPWKTCCRVAGEKIPSMAP